MVWIRQIINCRDMKSLFSWRYGPGLIRAHTVEKREKDRISSEVLLLAKVLLS